MAKPVAVPMNVNANAAPEDPVRAEQGRLEGTFTEFSYSSVEPFTIKLSDTVVGIKISELRSQRALWTALPTRL